MILSLEQKHIILQTLYWEGQYNQHIYEEAYGDTAAWKALETWISQVLNLDFRNDIYNNEKVAHMSKLTSVKNHMKKVGSHSWFIGDSLKEVLAQAAWKGGGDLTPNSIILLDDYIVLLWSEFQKACDESGKSKWAYVETDVIVNGEKLYRRVENEV